MLYVNKIFAYGKPRARLVFISWRTVKLYETQSTVKLVFEYSHVGCVHSGPDLPIGYAGLSLGPQKSANCGTHRSIAVTVYDQFDKYTFVSNFCFSFLFIWSDFVSITPGSSNEFSWISEWPLVKPHADCSVDILKALWPRPAFGESCRLLCELGKGFDTHLIKA